MIPSEMAEWIRLDDRIRPDAPMATKQRVPQGLGGDYGAAIMTDALERDVVSPAHRNQSDRATIHQSQITPVPPTRISARERVLVQGAYGVYTGVYLGFLERVGISLLSVYANI